MKESNGIYARWQLMRNYTQSMRKIFGVWDEFFEKRRSFGWMSYEQIRDTLMRMRVTLDILEGFHLFDMLSSLGIASKNSGFPNRLHIDQLTYELNGSHDHSDLAEETRQLKRAFLENLTTSSEINIALLERISKAQSREVLAAHNIFSPFTFNGIEELKVRDKGKRRAFLCSWERYVVQNIPVKYIMLFEVSDQWSGNHDNLQQLIHVLREETLLITKMSDLARHIDLSHALIHPKWIERVIFGPVFISNLTEDEHQLQQALDRCAKNGELITASRIIHEYVIAKKEHPSRKITDSFARFHTCLQEFGVLQQEPEHAQRGVTRVEKHLFVPHCVIQQMDEAYVKEIGHRLNSY